MPRLGHVALPALIVWALLGSCAPAPGTPEAAAERIDAHIRAGDLAAADELIRAAIRQWPEHARLRELQGDLDLTRGYGTRAQAAYERAIIRSPENRGLQVKLARSLLVQGRNREALAITGTEPADSEVVRAGFRLVKLEAGLAIGPLDFPARREEAEDLWRVVDSLPATPDIQSLRSRLEHLATTSGVIEAARQHARCRPSVAPARSAESKTVTGELIRVGPGQKLHRPSEAAAVAKDGAVIEIEAGDYEGDVAVWTQNNLTLRGRNGRPRLRASGNIAADKAIWVIRGNRTVVETIEFSGARASNHNGAGIWLEGSHLTVRSSVFRGNEMGIVTTDDTPDSEILITGSEFAANATNTQDHSLGHNVYIGRVARVTLEFSHVHGARYGDDVKSRARSTQVNYNRIGDGPDGRAGYLIDIPEGGIAEIVGNELQKGSDAENAPFISYGAEAGRQHHADNALYVVNNSFYSEAPKAVGVDIRLVAPALVVNNLFTGAALTQVNGKAGEAGNLFVTSGLVNTRADDFHLMRDSRAIDAGVDPHSLMAAAPLAEFEYQDPVGGVARPKVWTIDAGAHEFCEGPRTPAPGVDLSPLGP